MQESAIEKQLVDNFNSVLYEKDQLYEDVLKDYGKLRTVATHDWPTAKELNEFREGQKDKFTLAMWHMILPSRGAVHQTDSFPTHETHHRQSTPTQEQKDNAKSGYSDIIRDDIRNVGTRVYQTYRPGGHWSTKYLDTYYKLELKLGRGKTPAHFDKTAFQNMLDLGITRYDLLHNFGLPPVVAASRKNTRLLYTYSE